MPMYSFHQVTAIAYGTIAVIMLLIYVSNRFLKFGRDRVTVLYMKMLWADICMLSAYTISFGMPYCDENIPNIILFHGLGDTIYFLILTYFGYYVTAFIASRTEVSLLPARLCALICVFFGLFWFIGAFMGWTYVVEEDGFSRGPYYQFGRLGSFAIILICIVLILHFRKVLGLGNVLSFMLFCLLPGFVVITHLFHQHIPLMPILLSFSIVLIHALSQAEHHREQLIRLERARMAVMMSQIRPHFIYNVLNSIYALCDISTERTKEAIADFSDYLRTNLSPDLSEKLITFSKELEHTENYLELEKLRYGSRLETVYEISDRDFLVPVLSIQPLVENAVRHGVSRKVEGGSVKILTRRSNGGHQVVIEDDGVGFDTSFVNIGDESENGHIGLENARSRIETMCGGNVKIESTPGEGTRVEIFIPDGGKERHEYSGS